MEVLSNYLSELQECFEWKSETAEATHEEAFLFACMWVERTYMDPFSTFVAVQMNLLIVKLGSR